MKISQNLLRSDANNFTAVRLVLAASVIYSHSYWRTTGIENVDDLSALLGTSVGSCAVEGFFFLSGFLVYGSLQRLRSSGRFAVARFVRLWPGLAVSVLATALAGWTITSASGLSYLGGDTARFVLGNLSLLRSFFTLTGVHCGAQLCNINGSLWTLPWEVKCYAVLALLGLVGLASPRWMVRLVLPATVFFAFAWNLSSVRLISESVFGHGAAFSLDILHELWPLFALGIASYIFRDRLVLSWWIVGVLAAANLVLHGTPVLLQARSLLIGYSVLCAGLLTARTAPLSGRWPDYSYGTYIYAFPIMDAVYALWPVFSHWILGAVTLLLTLPVAAMSWHAVEKPALNALRRHIESRRVSKAQAVATEAT
jgi:peptidoglycan/LPS O-acetylase OafA/YrhL